MKPILEIKSKTGIVHFRRWELLKTPWFSVWIHGIYSADKDQYLHNHPWDYCSWVLKGSFIEKTDAGENKMTPGSFVNRDGSLFHKIQSVIESPVYTLFIATQPKRDWGYMVNGKFMQHEIYRKRKNDFLL